MSTLKDEVQAYLKSDRQWFREQRIAHARFMLATATPARKPFWRMVLAANGAS